MKTQSDKQILDYKKSKFLSFVEESARYHQVPIPKVKFWKEYDSSHFNKGERAHIHQDTETICIANSELENMNEDEIKETASHEVTHLYDTGHETRFQNKRIDTEASLWTPPHGTVGAIPEKEFRKKDLNKKREKEKIIKNKCNYHQCNKKGKTYQCTYCKKYFCKKHKDPKCVSMCLTNDNSNWGQILMKEYHREDAHPCMSYNHYLEEKTKKENEEYIESLDIMCGKSKKIRGVYELKNEKSFKNIGLTYLNKIENEKDEPIKKNNKKEEKINNSKNKVIKSLIPKNNPIEEIEEILSKRTKKKDIVFWISVGIIIFLLLEATFLFFNETKTNNLPKCSDGTIYNMCSKDKPSYCYEGKLINKASTCGCPEGYSVDFQGCKK